MWEEDEEEEEKEVTSLVCVVNNSVCRANVLFHSYCGECGVLCGAEGGKKRGGGEGM